ncbi:unnamed protein product [Nippostrongylus brasiliensis]|uniref:Pecanex-like protein n=1 Tax=Nippostrongylus brasiliensis TaxID=27835 RepID=A0A0N4YE95_NIPBR|nr:unnamed protein product [Nippostrongylus brasiliensis]
MGDFDGIERIYRRRVSETARPFMNLGSSFGGINIRIRLISRIRPPEKVQQYNYEYYHAGTDMDLSVVTVLASILLNPFVASHLAFLAVGAVSVAGLRTLHSLCTTFLSYWLRSMAHLPTVPEPSGSDAASHQDENTAMQTILFVVIPVHVDNVKLHVKLG